VTLVQFVSLFRDGQKASMSTRSGEYVTLRQLRAEVGNDACRFFYMLRKCDQAPGFRPRPGQVAEQRQPGVLRPVRPRPHLLGAGAVGRRRGALAGPTWRRCSTSANSPCARGWPNSPNWSSIAARDYAPHALAFYLKDLAGDFHGWYNAERVLVDDAATARGAPGAGAGDAPGAAERAFPAGCFATNEHVTMGKFDQTSGGGPRGAAGTQEKSAGGTLLGMFIGLVIGISIAFGVVWYLNKSPLPFQNKYEGAPKARTASRAAQAPPPPRRRPCPASPATSRPTGASSSTTCSKASSRPRPGTAAPAATPGGPPHPRRRRQAGTGTVFFLQVGAFQKPADADNLKAKLALTGLEAGVQEVSIPEKGTMHRVRDPSAPFRDQTGEEMNNGARLLGAALARTPQRGGGAAQGHACLDVKAARILDTNLIGMAQTLQPFVAAMKARGSGRLAGIASVAGIRGLPGAGAYSASKAATIAWLEALRVELRGSGVRVVTIAPGYIATPMTAVNRYPMPFLMPADTAARHFARAIERGTSYTVIPWQMGVAAKLLRLLPDPLFDALFARAGRKPRGLDL
jgi:hypothetical protein